MYMVNKKYRKPKWQIVWLLVCFFIVAQTAVMQAQAPVNISKSIEKVNGKEYFLHKVESKQTMYGISKAYQITIETLLEFNPDARNGIRVNQVLRIPKNKAERLEGQKNTIPSNNTKSDDEEYEYVYHVAGKNENFAYIADVYLINERTIRAANPSRSEPFNEGDYILIPVSKKVKPSTATEPRYQRSNYDPFTRPVPKNQNPETASKSIGQPEATQPVRTVTHPGVNEQNNAQTLKPETNQPTQPVMPPQGGTEKESQRHVVKPSETLSSIARLYNLSPSEILELNPGISESLKIGQVLRIPDQIPPATKTSAANDEMFYHTVQKGETLYKISRQYAVTTDELKQLNKGLTETMQVGQKVLIPKKKITKPYIVFQVESKDKTKQLARKFGLTVDDLIRLNPAIGKDVFPNQRVLIPIDQKVDVEPVKIGVATEKKPVLEENSQKKAEQIDAIANCQENPSNKNKTYTVALMLPLYLDEVSALKDNNPRTNVEANKPRPFTFLPFYNGFVLAADSLASYYGLKLEILVYDVDQSIAKAAEALRDPKLKKADLIVGPFFSQQFEMVASFAFDNKITIVNPMSQRRSILDNNPYVVKVKPDVSAQFEQVAAAIRGNYPKAKVSVYYSASLQNSSEVKSIKEAIYKYIPNNIKISNAELYDHASKGAKSPVGIPSSVSYEGKWIDINQLYRNLNDSTTFSNEVFITTYEQDSLRSFRRNASPIRDNVVVVYSEDRVFAMEFVNKLNQITDTLQVKMIGLPDWSRFDNLFNESLLKVNAHYLEPGFINYNDPSTQLFVRQYRSKYISDPEVYAFEGFDLGWYFLSSLLRYGKNEPACLTQHIETLLHTTYSFNRLSENGGVENMFWNMYSFRNYQLMPVKNAYFYFQ